MQRTNFPLGINNVYIYLNMSIGLFFCRDVVFCIACKQQTQQLKCSIYCRVFFSMIEHYYLYIKQSPEGISCAIALMRMKRSKCDGTS